MCIRDRISTSENYSSAQLPNEYRNSIHVAFASEQTPQSETLDNLTFQDVKDHANLYKYLAQVPQCSLQDLKKLEEEEIQSL